MENLSHDIFIPNVLEKELNILQKNKFDFLKTFNNFFNDLSPENPNNQTNYFFRKKILNDDNLTIFENKNHKDNFDANEDFNFIFPNCSKEIIINALKKFDAINRNCLNQHRNENHTEYNKTNEKSSLFSSIFSSAKNSLFGVNNIDKKIYSIFDNVIKINNIEHNCDYFSLDIKYNQNTSRNYLFFNKLRKSNHISLKNYNLFRYFFDKSSLFENTDKIPKNLNCVSTKNDFMTFNISEGLENNNYLSSYNNDDTADDSKIKFKLPSTNKGILTKTFFENKNFDKLNEKDNLARNFSFVFFKFRGKNKQENFNNNYHKSSQYPEDEFVLVIALLDINTDKLISCDNKKSNSDDKSEIHFKKNKNCSERINYVKVNLAIFTMKQVEELGNNNITTCYNEKLKNYFEENTHNNLFIAILSYFQSFIFSNVKNLTSIEKINKEAEDKVVEYLNLLIDKSRRSSGYESLSNEVISPLSLNYKKDSIEVDKNNFKLSFHENESDVSNNGNKLIQNFSSLNKIVF